MIILFKVNIQIVADTIAAWANRYVSGETLLATRESDVAHGEVEVEERNHEFAQNVRSDSHFWLADEPTAVGGTNLGPDPYEHLLAAR